MLVFEQRVDDGIENELAAASADEPVVGEGDIELRALSSGFGLGGGVYHVLKLVRAGARCWRR